MKPQNFPSQKDIEKFKKDGYIKLNGVATEQQIKQFRQIMVKKVTEISQKQDKQSRIDDYSDIFTQVTNLWRQEPKAQQFILNQKFGSIAKKLLETERVRLYHDQALIKQSKAGKTPWHQDYFYWPIDTQKVLTMWIPMHDCPKQMGTMKFVKYSHISQQIQKMPISNHSQAYFQNQIIQKNFQTQTFDLKLGDATFHLGKTLHCAHGNGCYGNRQVMTIIYMADGAKVVKEQQMNEYRYTDLKVFCPGIKCQQIINSELNPIIS